MHSITYPLLLVALVLGCNRPAPQRDYELPLVEPKVADAPDQAARAQYATTPTDFQSRDDWPALLGPHRTSRGDVSANVIWPDTGPPLLWEAEMGTGYGSPVVADGRVVVSHRVGDEEIVQCHRAEDGILLWQHRYSTTAQCEFEYSNGPYSTPVIDAKSRRVFHIGGQGQFDCLDLDDGHVVWHRELHAEYDVEPAIFPVGTSPLLDGDQLILNLGAGSQNAGVIAMDAATGETRWTAMDHGVAYAMPVVTSVHGKRFVLLMTDKGLISLNPDTGEFDWFVELFSKAPMSYNSVSPIVHDDKVLAVTGPGPGAICLRILPDRGHEQVWKDRRIIDCQYNTLMLRDGLVYAFTSAGQGGAELRCVDFATGKLRWRYHSILRRGQGLIAGNAMILLGERGHLASVLCGEDEPRVLSFTQEPVMSEPCFGTPAVSGKRLFIKDEKRLAAFDLGN